MAVEAAEQNLTSITTQAKTILKLYSCAKCLEVGLTRPIIAGFSLAEMELYAA